MITPFKKEKPTFRNPSPFRDESRIIAELEENPLLF